MSKPEAKARIIPCYPVSDEHLGDALAGRLLPVPNASKNDRDSAEWLYRDGLAAGIRWARELATPENLRQLAAESGIPKLSPCRGCMASSTAPWAAELTGQKRARRRDTEPI
jgi:hypothetical protein